MKYLSITITTTVETADIVSLILIEEGSEGTGIKDSRDLKEIMRGGSWDYVDNNILSDDENVYVSGVFAWDYDMKNLSDRLDELRENSPFDVGSLKIIAASMDNADYENEWKKYYKVLEIDKVAIVPAWLKYDGNLLPVLLNPGKAFGTGGHETTSMCVELMQALDLKAKRVIDLGCGSGILGLTALRLGAENCFMVDVDPQAMEATRENAALNGMERRIRIFEGEPDASKIQNADIILANLTADILIKYKQLFTDFLNSMGKYLIVSGIINSRIDDVLSAFKHFKILRREQKGEWQAILFANSRA